MTKTNETVFQVLNVADGLGYLHGLVPPIYHGSLEVVCPVLSFQSIEFLLELVGACSCRRLWYRTDRRLWTYSCAPRFPGSVPIERCPTIQPPILLAGGSRVRWILPQSWKRCMGLRMCPSSCESPERTPVCRLTGNQVVTDLLPYADCAEGTAVRESIGRGELPANTSAISAPWFISFALDLCWERDPGSRLRTSWFSTILSQNAADCFSLLAKLPFGKVPVRWKSETPSWQAVVNPCLQTVYRVEPQLGFEDSENSRSVTTPPLSLPLNC